MIGSRVARTGTRSVAGEPYPLAMALADTGELPPSVPSPSNSTARLDSRLAAFAVRAYWLWPALIMLAAGAFEVGSPSLWADELATWGAVQMGWGPLFHLLGHVDAVVGPYYVVVKLWASVAGTSAAALRMPSVVAMAVAAGLLTVLGTRLYGRWIGLLAGLIFALTPTTSRFAQEARPYAFAILFAIAASLLLVRFLERPTTGTGLGYAACIALLAVFHIMGLLLLLAHAVVVWKPAGPDSGGARRRLARWAGWAGAGVLPALPLAWLGYQQRSQIAWIPPASLHVVLNSSDVLFVSGTAGGAIVVLGLLGMTRRSRSGSGARDVLLLATWALVPLAVLAVAGQFEPLFYARYVLFVVPAWVLLAALALGRLPRLPALVVVLVLTLLGGPTENSIRNPDGHPTASAAAGSVIAANERPGDAVAYKLTESAPWEARDIVARYVPADRRPRDVFATVPPRANGYLAATECADLRACLDQAGDPARMWVIRRGSQPDPLDGIGDAKENLLRARYRLVRIWFVKGLTMGLYAHD